MAEKRMWTIYALCEPGTQTVRYVGVTHRSLQRRITEHLRNSIRRNTHTARWLKSLQSKGLKPDVLILSQGLDKWAIAERGWIAYYRFVGAHLTNLTDGGEGTLGHTHIKTAIWRQRLSQALRGVKLSPERVARMRLYHPSEEARRKNGLARLGTKQSPEWIEKRVAPLRGRKRPAHVMEILRQSRLGAKASPETCLRISTAKRGVKQSPETIAKRVVKLRGRKAGAEERRRKSLSALARAPFSAETRARMSAAHRGKPLPPEQCEKLRQASLRAWAKRKGAA